MKQNGTTFIQANFLIFRPQSPAAVSARVNGNVLSNSLNRTAASVRRSAFRTVCFGMEDLRGGLRFGRAPRPRQRPGAGRECV